MTSVAIKGIRRSVLGGFTSNKGDHLVLTPGSQSVPITWELVKHLNLQVSSQTYWIRKVESLCFISSLGDSDSCPRLRTTGRGTQKGLPEKMGESEKEEAQKYHPRGRSWPQSELSPFEKLNVVGASVEENGGKQPGGRGLVTFGRDFTVYIEVYGTPLTGFEQGSTFSGQ